MPTVYTQYEALEEAIVRTGAHRLMLVCGRSAASLPLYEALMTLPARRGIEVFRFGDFAPNPSSTSVEAGLDFFGDHACDCILAVGGGSAMDVAKCVRFFAGEKARPLTLKEKPSADMPPFFAVPTTAGSGSEATRFAVIYVNGVKASVDNVALLPDGVLLDGSLLASLPAYHKKSTALDALCHATESIWSVHSTDESEAFAVSAIRGILANLPAYLQGSAAAADAMLRAAYEAGAAINYTRTTAGHAMAYKLTTTYGFAHGHAVALCVSVLWPQMLGTPDARLQAQLEKIAAAYGADSPAAAAEAFRKLVFSLGLPKLPEMDDAAYRVLAASVDPQRLSNHPVPLTAEDIDTLYRRIKAEEALHAD